jgi:hypothetical protein
MQSQKLGFQVWCTNIFQEQSQEAKTNGSMKGTTAAAAAAALLLLSFIQ